MRFITAVDENGAFRPTEPVALSEGTTVLVQTPEEPINVRDLVPPGIEEEQVQIYECLARSYETGDAQAAAHHDEHQP
jgi:predicted DNA-binding antitoxin AbrB/MazE fold protein